MTRYILFFLLTALFSCSNGKADPENIIFSMFVNHSLNERKTELNKIRSEIEFVSGSKANNCNSYLRWIKKEKIKEDVKNSLAKSEYLVCDVLNLLQGKTYIKEEGNKNNMILLAKRLDITTFSSSLRPLVVEKRRTLDKISGNKLIISNDKIIFEQDDWIYQLKLVAKADINNNQKTDWVLWFSDEAKDGNYRNYQTLIVYDIESGRPLIKASAFP